MRPSRTSTPTLALPTPISSMPATRTGSSSIDQPYRIPTRHSRSGHTIPILRLLPLALQSPKRASRFLRAVVSGKRSGYRLPLSGRCVSLRDSQNSREEGEEKDRKLLEVHGFNWGMVV
jgi:hypothetical protein